MRFLALAIFVVCAMAAAVLGRGSSRTSVLDEGISTHFGRGVHRISDAEAQRDVAASEAFWRAQLRSRARASPRERFANLRPQALRSRVAEAERRYGFDVVSVDLLRPRQLAPRIVVHTGDYLRLSRAIPKFIRRLDPKARTNDDRTGWRYEGFWFEAVDDKGVPFVVVHNFWRGAEGGGGQWARSERLYPFAHG